jgi:hypothetical protein
MQYMERRKFLPLPGVELEPFGRSARSSVPTALFQLPHPYKTDNYGFVYFKLYICKNENL